MAKAIIKQTAENAFGVFKKAVGAGTKKELDDGMLRYAFDSLSEVYSAGEQTVKKSLGNGVTKTVTENPIDYNRMIDDIGNQFGYENLSKGNKKMFDGLDFTGESKYSAAYEHIYRSNNPPKAPKRSNMSYKERKDYADWWEGQLNANKPIVTEAPPRRVGGKTIEERLGGTGHRIVGGQTFDQRLGDLKIRKLDQIDQQAKETILKGRDFERVNKRTKNAYRDFVKTEETKLNTLLGDAGSNPNTKYNAGPDAVDNTVKDKATAQEVLDNATGKDGLNLWQKAKDHPVIATALVMGTAWGISEMVEDDSF